MARVTVEDCVDKVPNRFDLVLLAAQRAREISGGAELTIDRDRDKNPVVALREIAEETVRPKELHEWSWSVLQQILPDDEDEADEIGSLSQSAEALRITAAAPAARPRSAAITTAERSPETRTHGAACKGGPFASEPWSGAAAGLRPAGRRSAWMRRPSSDRRRRRRG